MNPIWCDVWVTSQELWEQNLLGFVPTTSHWTRGYFFNKKVPGRMRLPFKKLDTFQVLPARWFCMTKTVCAPACHCLQSLITACGFKKSLIKAVNVRKKVWNGIPAAMQWESCCVPAYLCSVFKPPKYNGNALFMSIHLSI